MSAAVGASGISSSSVDSIFSEASVDCFATDFLLAIAFAMSFLSCELSSSDEALAAPDDTAAAALPETEYDEADETGAGNYCYVTAYMPTVGIRNADKAVLTIGDVTCTVK